MKQSLTFSELVSRVEHEAKSRRDFYVPSGEMHLQSDSTGSHLATPCGHFLMKDTAHYHLAEQCNIDRRYYQKLRKEAPFLLDRNVNHWLTSTPSKPRIVRALEGESGHQARALVSARYARLDNDALMRAVEPIREETGLTVESCDMNDSKLTIKWVSPLLTGEVKVNDAVQVGIIVRNSEVRFSAVQVDFFVKRLICSNGMVVSRSGGPGAFRRHVGRDWEASRRKAQSKAQGKEQGALYPTSTVPAIGPIPDDTERQQWERDIWEGFQTTLRSTLNTDAFQALLEGLGATTRLTTRRYPEQVVRRLARAFHLQPSEQEAVTAHLCNDEDVSRNGVTLWSVLNAVTRAAQDVSDYERATELEELGGHLSRLNPGHWRGLVGPI